MFGDPNDTSTAKQTWGRYCHVGWNDAPTVGQDWPKDLTRTELEGTGFSGITMSLWKPLSSDPADGDPAHNVPTSAGKVEDIAPLGHGTARYLCVDTTGTIQLIHPYGPTSTYPAWAGPGDDPNIVAAGRVRYVGLYRRWDPMNGKIFGTPGTESSNVMWAPGFTIGNYPKLGAPNVSYPLGRYPGAGIGTSFYQRKWERNFKVVDGDLPSIGWLGELILKNAAQDGPLTLVHTSPQNPASATSANLLDGVKFNLFNPFNASGDPRNLHVLDCFTVWDPSNDGIDNDGDGAVDDEDTGRQAGDRCGPEVRVFGRLDLNYAAHAAFLAAFPDLSSLDTRWDWKINKGAPNAGMANGNSRQGERGGNGRENQGPYETIGDLLRTDSLSSHPGSYMGFLSTVGSVDDDGDGITNERDERDMVFSWVSNYFTTRANVFELCVTVDIGPPPPYPGRKLPMKTWKSKTPYAHKQIVGVLDRSTTLRIEPNGSCDFTAPIDLRMLRFTDDVRVY
jgi:hypothetical protein